MKLKNCNWRTGTSMKIAYPILWPERAVDVQGVSNMLAAEPNGWVRRKNMGYA